MPTNRRKVFNRVQIILNFIILGLGFIFLLQSRGCDSPNAKQTTPTTLVVTLTPGTPTVPPTPTLPSTLHAPPTPVG